MLQTTKVRAVAPTITIPARFHWYFRVSVAGAHEPAVAVSVRSAFAVPEMTGLAVLVRIPVTAAVAAKVFITLLYPVFRPVTETVNALPMSAYVLTVAPVMATPARFHWCFSVIDAGAQVPSPAVSVEPTFVVPEIVGVGAVVRISVTTAVAAEVLVTVLYPSFAPVTDTVRDSPMSADFATYVLAVAPPPKAVGCEDVWARALTARVAQKADRRHR